MNKNKDQKSTVASRLGKVGGQAVLEGVMMKSGENCSVSVRLEDGTIKTVREKFTSVRKKHKWLGLPLLRGVVNFVEMMKLSYRTLMISAEAMGIEEEVSETKFEKWLNKTFGKSIVNVIMAIATVLGVVLGFGLFFYLPIFITKAIDGALGNSLGWFKNLIEGVLKIAIFIAYLLLVSLMKDIRRTFEYHGAEHKSIFCYEAGVELTPENAAKFKRFHPRCGTSFLFVMLLISILIFSLPFITWESSLLRLLTKLVMFPLIIGLGYEFTMYAGRHNNIFVRILSAPGLWMQRITTREPDLSQLEVAIASLKDALGDEFIDAASEQSSATENTENS